MIAKPSDSEPIIPHLLSHPYLYMYYSVIEVEQIHTKLIICHSLFEKYDYHCTGWIFRLLLSKLEISCNRHFAVLCHLFFICVAYPFSHLIFYCLDEESTAGDQPLFFQQIDSLLLMILEVFSDDRVEAIPPMPILLLNNDLFGFVIGDYCSLPILAEFFPLRQILQLIITFVGLYLFPLYFYFFPLRFDQIYQPLFTDEFLYFFLSIRCLPLLAQFFEWVRYLSAVFTFEPFAALDVAHVSHVEFYRDE